MDIRSTLSLLLSASLLAVPSLGEAQLAQPGAVISGTPSMTTVADATLAPPAPTSTGTASTQLVAPGVVMPGTGAGTVTTPGFMLTESALSDETLTTLSTKMDQVLFSILRSGQPSRVIVQARAGYRQWLEAQLRQAGIPTSDYRSIDALVAYLNAKQMAAVCVSIATDRCSVDAEVKASGAPLPTSSLTVMPVAGLANTALASMGLMTTANGGTGQSVAIIDSGISPTVALSSRIIDFVDFTSGRALRTRPYDDYGHGTHVAGLVAGQQYAADWGVQGVAPRTNLVGLKMLRADGSGTVSSVIAAIEYAVANRHRLRIGVINLSLGHPIFEAAATDPMVQAVEAAIRAGVVVVVSAGNYGMNADGKVGYAGITSPGNSPSAITVGAFNHQGTVDRADDMVADYSSRGPSWYDGYAKPDVVAPGHRLVSELAVNSTIARTYPQLVVRGRSGRSFLRLTGTSMAAAMASGVVALMKERMPALTPFLAKATLQYTALRLNKADGKPFDLLTQGTGSINGEGAMRLLASVNPRITDLHTKWTTLTTSCDTSMSVGGWPTNLSPAMRNYLASRRGLEVSGCAATVVNGVRYPWASTLVWGKNLVWGESLFYNLPIWGLNVVWGENLVWGESVPFQ